MEKTKKIQTETVEVTATTETNAEKVITETTATRETVEETATTGTNAAKIITETTEIKATETNPIQVKRTVNRQYKDSLFRMIFSNEEELLTLYNAINDTDYKDVERLTITTIEDVIFLGYKNDLSFVIEDRLGIYEHQSTWCGNMPLRNLIYIGKNYAGLVSSEKLYTTKTIKLPNPQFVVFYNGQTERPEREIVRLSDAYENKEIDPKLELEVVVLNVNVGYNQELMEKCTKLREYSVYINAVREYSKTIDIENAIRKAVEECIKNDILKEFLLKHREEVETVCLGEYNFQEHMEIVAKESREDGITEGLTQGRAEGLTQGRAEGLTQGRTEGLTQGIAHGEMNERIKNIKLMITMFLQLGMREIEIEDKLKEEFDKEIIQQVLHEIKA